MASGKVVLGALAAGFVLGAGLVAAPGLRERALAAAPSAPPVQAVATADGRAHLAVPGRPVLFKAILAPLGGGRVLRYRWEFGDGQASAEAPVLDPYAVEASHCYTAPPGARFEARLRVRDVRSGAEGVAAYPVEVVMPSVEALSAIALDDALWALHRGMTRWDDPLHGRLGGWNTTAHYAPTRSYEAGATALATLAFVTNGFDLRPERAGHPYTETVERGLDYLATRLVEADLGGAPRQDHGGNRRGLTTTTDRPLYEVPLVAMALVGSQAPDRPLGGANPAVSGHPARAVVGDLLDLVVAAQRTAGPAAGGWRYQPSGRDADLSVTQFPALALVGAERLWGLATPPAVKTALEGYLRTVQGKRGGYCYDPSYGESMSMTGAGLIALACAGVDGGDERVTRARAVIAADWASENVGHGYTMYAVMKAAKLGTPEVTRFGEHDWRAEYTLHLARTQRRDGSWAEDGRYGMGALATAWPALTLADDVFCSAAPVTSRSLAWTVAAGVAAAAAGAGALARLLRRRAV